MKTVLKISDASQLICLKPSFPLDTPKLTGSDRMELDPHVSLVYLPNGGIESPPPMVYPDGEGMLVLDWLDIWQVEEGYAVVLRPSIIPDWLRELQQRAYRAVQNLETSPYSTPSDWKPHMTLGYFSQPVINLPPIAPVVIAYEDVQVSIMGNTFSYTYTQDEATAIAVIDELIAEEAVTAEELGMGGNKILDKLLNVKRDVPLINQASGFKVLPNNRWIAFYTNAYKDKEREIIPLAELVKDAERMKATGEYPELWWRHLSATKHGMATHVKIIGRFAVAVGVFDDTPIAQAFKKYYSEHERTISHGFGYVVPEKQNGVYGTIRTKEISTLRPSTEANPYTSFLVFEENSMSAKINQLTIEDVKELKAALGDGEAAAKMATELITESLRMTNKLDAQGVENKVAESPDLSQRMDALEGNLTKAIESMTALMAKMTMPPEEDEGEEDAKEDTGKSLLPSTLDALDLEMFKFAQDYVENAEKLYAAQQTAPDQKRTQIVAEYDAFKATDGYSDGNRAKMLAAVGDDNYKILAGANLSHLIPVDQVQN